jgi:hypothetical protein
MYRDVQEAFGGAVVFERDLSPVREAMADPDGSGSQRVGASPKKSKKQTFVRKAGTDEAAGSTVEAGPARLHAGHGLSGPSGVTKKKAARK